MSPFPRLDRIFFTFAAPYVQEKGLLAWVEVDTCGFTIIGVTVRMTRDDLLIVTLPAKAKDTSGRRSPIVLIKDADQRRAFNDAVLDAFLEMQPGRTTNDGRHSVEGG